MADVFLNGSAVAGIEIKIRRKDEVPPGPRGEFVDTWVEVTVLAESGEPCVLHFHSGSASNMAHRLLTAVATKGY